MPEEEQKPVVTATQPTKSSMEILSELFGTFDAEPPLIIKKEKDESKKHKKSKKKHKHKDKKHKKKEKKRKRNGKSSSEHSEVDLAKLLIKQERQSPEKKIKIGDGHLVESLFDKIKSEKNDSKKDSEIKTSANKEKVNNKDSLKDQDDDDATQSNVKSKITIKNLKFSSILEATIHKIQEKEKSENTEEGELMSERSDDDSREKREKRKRKHKRTHHDDKVKSKRKKHSHRSRSSETNSDKLLKCGSKKEDQKVVKEGDHYKSKHDHKHDYYKSEYRSKDKYREDYYRDREDYKSRHKDIYKDKESRSRSRSHEDHKHHRHRENSFYKDESNYKIKEEFHDREYEEKWFMKDRYRGYGEQDRERERRYKERSNSSDRIDKKKLLEIARKNAIQMMKSGSLPAALTLGPQAQEKVLAAIKAGGKTIEELTDFCKTLSKKEELGELSSVSGEENGDDSDAENTAFHHPFQIKDRPTAIVMNIKNSVPLPTKTAQERTAELRMQFPVSSGTQHRKTENEWVPVSPKKVETPTATPVAKPAPQVPVTQPLAIEAPPPVIQPPPIPLPGPQVFPNSDPNIDIGSIVSQRLQAMRRLQENPYDVEALHEMHKSQQEMQTWAESKQQPGQFTGSTGANILTQAELASGYQAWARKDQLQNAAPVSGGMGMHLLKKMGWNPGEGLGKEKTGTLEPLLLEVKLDKKGLVANEEQRRRQQRAQKSTVKTLEGKHPVSLLGEYTAKKKLGAPQYTLCMESGPDHKKMFLFKVIVNGMEYQPDTASPNKKQAKADAAKLCLQKMGLLPP